MCEFDSRPWYLTMNEQDEFWYKSQDRKIPPFDAFDEALVNMLVKKLASLWKEIRPLETKISYRVASLRKRVPSKEFSLHLKLFNGLDEIELEKLYGEQRRISCAYRKIRAIMLGEKTSAFEKMLERARKASFEELLGSVHKRGKEMMLKCPFHKDTDPSLSVNVKENLFYCFGCGESGDIIDYVMKSQNVTFKQAVVYLGGR